MFSSLRPYPSLWPLGLSAALLAGAGAMGVAAAQSAGFNDVSTATGTEDTAARDTTLTGRRIADLTFPEAQSEVTRISSNGDNLSSRVMQLLSEARSAGRASAALCYDDVLTQVNARRTTLGDYVTAFNGSTSFDATARHNFTVITVIGQALTVLERRANECEGTSLAETGSTRVNVFIDPRTPLGSVRTISVPGTSTPGIPPPPSAP